ncbi:MAG TPA: hypothetical protein VND93_31830 [Myxococcales bacterium]|jgi:hypothetical protein|nr:hypothetical protein [Myxococcales bacterium]
MKKLAAGIAMSVLVMGCGGTEMDGNAGDDESSVVVSTQQALCEGFNNGATWCTAKCWSSWYKVGQYPAIAYGSCGAAADNFCRYWFGVSASGSCWSY